MESQTIDLRKTETKTSWADWLKSLEIGVYNPIDKASLFSVRPQISKLHYLTDMKFETKKVSGIPNVIRKA